MAEKKHILTYEGLKKYEDELQDLKVNRRREIAQKIKEAREQGDLSENAEYDAAKDEQRDIEARIEELEKLLKNAEVVVEDEVNLVEEAKRKTEKELAEAKKQAENYQFEKYKKEKYGIAWVERADGTRIGFDTDIEQGSQTDWNSVRRVLDDGIALGKFAEGVEPYAPYKYWISETEKEYGIVTLTELRLAGFISSEMQNAAYAKFEAIKKEIEACTTVEEVQKYLEGNAINNGVDFR